jgi:predicted transcriptional regulator
LDKSVDYLSEIFKALSTKERIIALETLSQGKINLKDLARKAGLSRSGFQNVLDDFRNARLIEHTEHRSYYRLSIKGKRVLGFLNELHKELSPIEEVLKKEQLKASIAKFGSGLSEQELLRLVKEVKEEPKNAQFEG